MASSMSCASALIVEPGTARLPDYGSLLGAESIARGGAKTPPFYERPRTRIGVLGMASALSVLLMAVCSWSTPLRRAGLPVEALVERPPPLVGVTNSYIDALGPIGAVYPWLPEGAVIVDAHRPARIHAVEPETGCSYEFGYTSADDPEDVGGARSGISRSSAFEVVFPRVGTWNVWATAYCQGIVTRKADRVAYALHVRREVRELTEEHRDDLLDAMLVMWTLGGAAGRAKYGPDYVSAVEFQVWHHVNAAQRDADHFHQGAGFFAQHARVTLQFEASLRALDPALSLPYWDCTIEQAAASLGRIDSIFATRLWSAEWWGSMTTKDDLTLEADTDLDVYAIGDGRFAETRVNSVVNYFSSGIYVGKLGNAYGLVRAPWNTNPSPFVSRYVATDVSSALIPGCETHYNATAVAPYPLHKWMWHVQFSPHATMHSTLGGQLKVPASEEAAILFTKITGHAITAVTFNNIVKQHTLFRLRVLDFPSDCGGVPAAYCKPVCNTKLFSYREIGRQMLLTQDIDRGGTWLVFQDSYDAYEAASAAFLDSVEASVAAADPADIAALGKAYCREPGLEISGDQKDSSGALDPVFWTMHPTMERLYQYRILSGVGFSSTDWPSADSCAGARADIAIVDRPAYVFAYTSASTEELLVQGSALNVCMGHEANSRMYCGNPDREEADLGDSDIANMLEDAFCGEALSGADPNVMDGGKSRLGRTNIEVLTLLDPRSNPASIKYEYPIYHHFNWDHCPDVGVTFPALDRSG